MGTVAIDIDMLNELFDKQKNLDDILNEDFFLDSSILIDDKASETIPLKDNLDIEFNKEMSSGSENKYFFQNSPRIIRLIVPIILEVAVISYCITYFN
jgi:hypothetical protein